MPGVVRVEDPWLVPQLRMVRLTIPVSGRSTFFASPPCAISGRHS